MLSNTTVLDDLAVDILTGGPGLDWFLFNNNPKDPNRDTVTDLDTREVITPIKKT